MESPTHSLNAFSWQSLRAAAVWLGQVLALAVAYYVFGRLGLLLAIPPGYATAVWAPAGIALAAVLNRGYRLAPGVWLGSFTLNLFISLSAAPDGALVSALGIAASIALGSMLQTLAGAWLIRRWAGFPNPLAGVQQIAGFLVWGGPVACLIGATWGVSTLALAGLVAPAEMAFSWWTWWAGDTIGVLLLTPLAVIACPTCQQSLRRKVTVALPMLATFALTVVAFASVRHWEQERTRLEFEQRSSVYATRLQQSFDKYLDALDALERLFTMSEKVDVHEFRNFVLPSLTRYPGLVGYSWNVAVKDQDRAAFELAARREGRNDFQVRQQSDGRLERAANRDEYVVIRYIEPLEENRPALGVDALHLPNRREALLLARDSGKPAATGSVSLVQRGQRQDGLLIFHPIYRQGAPRETVSQRRANLEGYVAAVLLMGEAVSASLQGLDPDDIVLRIEETNQAGESQVLYTNSVSGPILTPDVKTQASDLGYSFDYQVVGRTWTFRFLPTRAYLTNHRPWGLWLVTTGGVLFTSLLGAFLLVVTGQSARTEELVASRTAQLAESEQRIKLALENSRQGLWDWDIASGTAILDDNWAAILGYGPGTLPNHLTTWEESLHPDDKAAVYDKLQGHFESSANLYDVVYRAKTKSGGWIWVNSRGCVQARDLRGKPLRMMGTIQDVTERKLAEEQLAARAAELSRSNGELERFAYVASHDLREPLRMVLSFCTLLQERYHGKLDDRADKYIGFAVDGAKRMQMLVDDLLEYSRVGRSKERMESVDLHAVLDAALANLKLAIGESHARLCVDPLPWVRGDELRLTQVLQNLIGNALKFRGGDPPHISISAQREGNHWRLSVQDNGIGIDPQYFERIFVVFQRLHTQAEYPGTGIGLALCQRILELHGGKIWLESAVGRGTTFHFTLLPAEETSPEPLEGAPCPTELATA